MARAFSAKAGKDYPAIGVKKGETYYYWSFFRGPKQMSKTPPRQSQLTGSGKLSNVYAADEALQDALGEATCPDDVIGALTEAVDAVNNCIEEYEEAVSNLEEGFPNGCPAIDETTEAKDNLEAWRDELESAQTDVEGLDPTDFVDEGAEPDEGEEPREKAPETFDDLYPSERDAMMEEAQALAGAVSCPI